MDLCGKTKDLSEVQKFGVHGSGLTLDFRSNRINTGEGFFLALTCILPSAAGGSRRKRYSNSNYNYNYYNAPWSPVHKVVVQPTCTPSKTLTGKIVGRDSQDEPLRTAEEYFVRSHLYLVIVWVCGSDISKIETLTLSDH